MSLAIDDLMHEHDAILASFQLLDGMSHTLAVGKQIFADDVGLPQQSGPIAKENSVLFPMAENILEAAKLQTLFDQFEAHEA